MSKQLQGQAQGHGQSTVGNDTMIFIHPDEFVTDELMNVRPFSSRFDAEAELRSVQELADSMSAGGQVQPVEVRVREDGKFHLVVGHRRLKAAVLINLGKSENEVPFKLKAVVKTDMSDHEAIQHAIMENLHRKNFSPLDMTGNIQMLRERFGWAGKAGTKKVADFLKVHPATITQYEKLDRLVPELKEAVNAGRLQANAAFDLADEKPENQLKRFQEAAGVMQEEEAKAEAAGAAGEGAGKGKGPRKKGQVKQGHVRKAQRKAAEAGEDGVPVQKALSRKEILDYFDGVKNSPAYGFPDGAVREFARYLVDSWAEGKGSDRTLDLKLDEMSKGAPKGTKDAAEKENQRIAEGLKPKAKKETKPKKEPKPAAKKPAPKKAAKPAVAAKKK